MEERGTDLKLFAWKETSHSRDAAFEWVECEPRSGELAKRIASLPWRKGSDPATGSPTIRDGEVGWKASMVGDERCGDGLDGGGGDNRGRCRR